MQRRQFIRVAGGGVIVAATATAAGCSQRHAARSRRRLAGPGRRARPAPLDPRLRDPGAALAQPAVLAGGPARAGRDPAALRPAAPAARDRPVLAPDHDEPGHLHRTAGHGRARARPARRDHAVPRGRVRPAAARRAAGGAHPPACPTPAWPRTRCSRRSCARHTNRKRLRPARPVPADGLAGDGRRRSSRTRCASALSSRDRPEALQQHRAIAAEAWRIELTTPRTMMESYKVLRVGADRDRAAPRRPVADATRWWCWLDRLGLFDRSKAPAPDDFATTSQIKDFNAKLASTPAFLWMVSEGNDRVHPGQRRPRLRARAARRHRARRGDAAAAAGAAGVSRAGRAVRRHPRSCSARRSRRRRCRCGRASAMRRRSSRRRGAASMPIIPFARGLRRGPAARRSQPSRRAHPRPCCHRGAHPRCGRRGAGARRLRRDRRQRHRARGRHRQGADLPLLRRPERTAAQPGAPAGASGRRVEELLGEDPRPCWRCRCAERYALFFDRFIDALRRRPLTLEILAAEIVERNELTAILETEREQWGAQVEGAVRRRRLRSAPRSCAASRCCWWPACSTCWCARARSASSAASTCAAMPAGPR